MDHVDVTIDSKPDVGQPAVLLVAFGLVVLQIASSIGHVLKEELQALGRLRPAGFNTLDPRTGLGRNQPQPNCRTINVIGRNAMKPAQGLGTEKIFSYCIPYSSSEDRERYLLSVGEMLDKFPLFSNKRRRG